MTWWWLSFVSNVSEKDVNLGVIISEGDSMLAAVAMTHVRGINPGGQVMGMELPDDDPEAVAEREKWGVDRLITSAELLADGGYKKLGELRREFGDESVDAFKAEHTVDLCEEHNK